jgi:streptogramin lyase
VRVARRSYAAGGVNVRPALTNALDVAVEPDGRLLVGDFDHYVFRGAPGSRVTVVAGNGKPGSSGDGGPAVAAAVGFPVEVAVDPRGGFGIVSDERLVRHVAPDGTISTVAQLDLPTALAYDREGDIFVSELGGRVRRIDAASGTVTTYAGVGGEGFGGDGGPATAAQLYRPHGLVVDASGVLYFCDTFNDRVRRVDPVTHVITTVAANLGSPNDIALGPDGALYVSEFGNNRISRITTTGEVTNVVDAPGTNSVALDSEGRVYFTERTAPRVRRFDPMTGTTSIVLGR